MEAVYRHLISEEMKAAKPKLAKEIMDAKKLGPKGYVKKNRIYLDKLVAEIKSQGKEAEFLNAINDKFKTRFTSLKQITRAEVSEEIMNEDTITKLTVGFLIGVVSVFSAMISGNILALLPGMIVLYIMIAMITSGKF